MKINDSGLADFYLQVGENIKKFRTKQKLSQDELARLIGLTRTSMTNIEKGRQHPPLHIFCEIVEHLKVELSDLLPHHAMREDSIDLKALASGQVRGARELAFIETAIKGVRFSGNTKSKDSDDDREALS